MTAAADRNQYGSVADLYDHVPLYRERADVAFYLGLARETSGPVLEIGCGTGRILIPTARAAVEIMGLDFSPHMLDICRDRVKQESAEVQSRVQLAEGDMRAFDLAREFSLITLPFRPFQHLLTVEDQIACLRSVRRHLIPGGRVALDLFNPSLDALANQKDGVEFGHEPEFSTPDGRRVVRSHKTVSHDRFNQIKYVELVYNVAHSNGRTERQVHAFGMRYLFRFEMEHLLARCGFEVEHVYAGFDMGEYGSQYPGELIFVAKRI